MMENQFVFGSMTLILLLVAIIIFSILAIKSKNIRSFQFQTSIFVVIWIIGETVGILHEQGVINHDMEDLGMQIHLGSMVFLSCMLCLRYYHSKNGGKKMIESLEDDN